MRRHLSGNWEETSGLVILGKTFLAEGSRAKALVLL